MRYFAKRIETRIHGMSMQKKLMFSFSIPMILISLMIYFVASPILNEKFQSQKQYSIRQSCAQAKAFIANHVDNMNYVLLIIEDNKKLLNVLEDAAYGKKEDLADTYREYLALVTALTEIRSYNFAYEIGIYLPDSMIYTNDNKIVFPESDLKDLANYSEMEEILDKGRTFCQIMKSDKIDNSSESQYYINMLKKIHILRNGQSYDYVIRAGVPLKEIDEILNNVKDCPDNLVYLLNETDECLTTTNQTLFEMAKMQLPHNSMEFFSEVSVAGKEYYAIYEPINGCDWKLFSLIPVQDYKEQMAYVGIVITLMTIMLVIAVVIVSHSLSIYYVKRLVNLNHKMKSLEEGEMNTSISLQENSEESHDEIDEIYHNFNKMSLELKNVMKEHYRLGKKVMSSELKALQAQINPHFLYNTLDMINWRAMDLGADDVADMARNLGQFYRLSLNKGRSAIVIEEELRHVQAYFNIEQIHFPGALFLEMQVPEQIRECACLNIILQPFVENCIVHGIAEHPDIMECNIKISAWMEEEDIVFRIQDDGPGMTEEQMDSILLDDVAVFNHGYGVKNINFRIKLCFGERYGVTYCKDAAEGTTVRIRIPVISYEELEEKLR